MVIGVAVMSFHVNVESELEQKIEAFCRKLDENEVPLFAKP